MKRLMLFLFVAYSTLIFAQNNIDREYELDGVIISALTIECMGNEFLTFEIVNTNPYAVSVTWREEISINGKKIGEGDDFLKSFFVEANATLVGDCTFKESSYIEKRLNRGGYLRNLTSFDLNSINVNKK